MNSILAEQEAIGKKLTIDEKVSAFISGETSNITLSLLQPSPRNEHISFSFKGKMWVIGGKNASTNLADVWSSSTGLAWNEHTLTNGFSARQGHAGVVFKNKMWVFGGYFNNPGGGGTYLNDIYSSEDGLTWVFASYPIFLLFLLIAFTATDMFSRVLN